MKNVWVWVRVEVFVSTDVSRRRNNKHRKGRRRRKRRMRKIACKLSVDKAKQGSISPKLNRGSRMFCNLQQSKGRKGIGCYQLACYPRRLQ